MVRLVKINGIPVEDIIYEERKAVAVEMWYDRHYRHWVIYPVDIEGNQIDEARYGFGRKEAEWIKKEFEEEIMEGK